MEELEKYCFKMIGEGTTACIRKNCTMDHRSGKLLMVLPNEAYVVKTKDRIFVEPRLENIAKIPEGVGGTVECS